MRQMSLSRQSHARVDEETQSFLEALFPQCSKTQSLIKTPLLSHQWLHGVKLDGYYFLVSSFHPPPPHTLSLSFVSLHFAPAVCFLLGCLMSICNFMSY